MVARALYESLWLMQGSAPQRKHVLQDHSHSSTKCKLRSPPEPLRCDKLLEGLTEFTAVPSSRERILVKPAKESVQPAGPDVLGAVFIVLCLGVLCLGMNV